MLAVFPIPAHRMTIRPIGRIQFNDRTASRLPHPRSSQDFGIVFSTVRVETACLRFEPNLASLKGWQPHQKSNGPYARTLSVSVNTRMFWRWAGRRSNPSLLVFSQALHHLSYQPRL
jgi:hypothetical protein